MTLTPEERERIERECRESSICQNQCLRCHEIFNSGTLYCPSCNRVRFVRVVDRVDRPWPYDYLNQLP